MHTQVVPDGIQQIVTRQMEAWAQGDAVAFAADFSQDAVFVTVRGDLVHGRPDIEANHAFIFNGPYKGTKLQESVDLILTLSASVIVAHISVEVSNIAAFPPGVTPHGPGVLRTRLLFVFVEEEGEWRIASAQNTIVAPTPTQK